MAASGKISGVAPDISGGRLTINLMALVRNWQKLNRFSAPARAAAVVKADAYGLGAGLVADALYKAGCRDFFVAYPDEGRAVREAAPLAKIYVLTGAFQSAADFWLESDLIPLLCSSAQVEHWLRQSGHFRPFGLNVDTGMNRLGLTISEAVKLSGHLIELKVAGLCHIMSHLACADEPEHEANARQIKAFHMVRPKFPGIQSSLYNSAGIFRPRRYPTEMTRPGIAIFGGEAVNGAENLMETVVTAETRILQIRDAKAGESVSYGATTILERDTRIAVAGTGYADGIARASGGGVALRAAQPATGSGFIRGKKAPILGRVTMDLMMFDITDFKGHAITEGDFIELFGENISLDDAARSAGTIGYELLTSLGRRYHRRYAAGIA